MRNSCVITVKGYYELYPETVAQRAGNLAKDPHSCSRPRKTQTKPILDQVRMYSCNMVVIKNHLKTCTTCQPGAIMTAFTKRALGIGHANTDVLKMAEWAYKHFPTKATKRALKVLLALDATYQTHRV